MLHHLALTASSLARSRPFYDAVLSSLGYARTLTRDQLAAWEGPEPEILLYQARVGQEDAKHTLYDPGIHHIAFRAGARDIVDRVERRVVELNGTILESAREYPHYAPGYYAVFFLDPDGIKFEVMHV